MRRLALAAGLLTACSTPQHPDSLPSRGLAVAPPDRSVFLRASFDDDPSGYVGRFLPDGLEPGEIDEVRAAQTRCSQFVTTEVVNAGGSFDETFNSSSGVRASLGASGIASLGGGTSAEQGLRVKYQLARKMRARIADAAGFDRCCKAAPDQCASRILGEFLFGTGSIFQAAGSEADFAAEGQKGIVSADVEFKDQVAWKRLTEFQDVYFAFRTTATRLDAGTQPSAPDDCSWASRVPTSLDGQYFVGISPPAASEAAARDLAMRSAREQAVKFIGESLTTSSATSSSALDGVLEDQAVVQAAASGIARRVKDERWCPATTQDTPRGAMVSVKVLAFFPQAEQAAATQEVVQAVEQSGKLDPAAKKELETVKKSLE